MNRPTPEQIAEARWLLIDGGTASAEGKTIVDDSELSAIRVLLAATEPPTDEEIAELAVQRYCDPSERFDYYDREAISSIRDATPHGSIYAFAACFSLGIRAMFGPVKP